MSSTSNVEGETLERLLTVRHSCRGFLERPVDRKVIEKIFRAAQRTASWCNSQAWQVAVVSGAGIERLREALLRAELDGAPHASDLRFPTEYRGVYLERRRECGFQLYESVGIQRGDRAGYARQGLENYRMFGAPHVAILTSDPYLGIYGAIDVGGYVQVLLLAMQSEGIAAIAQAALAARSDLIKSALCIDATRLVVCAVSFGYEDTENVANGYRTSRASLEEAITWVDA